MHHDLMIKLCISHAASMSTLPCHKKSAKKTSATQRPVHGKTPTFVSRLRFPVLLFLQSHPILFKYTIAENIFGETYYFLEGCDIYIYMCVWKRFHFSQQHKACTT